MKRRFAFQQAQISFYVLAIKRLFAFLFPVLFVDSLIAIHPQFTYLSSLKYGSPKCCGGWSSRFLRRLEMHSTTMVTM